MVELESQSQQQAALEHPAGHPWIADCAEQDRVVAAEFFKHRIGQRLTGRVPAPGAEVILGALDLHVVSRRHRIENLQALVDHLWSDAVAGNNRETHAASHTPRIPTVSETAQQVSACETERPAHHRVEAVPMGRCG